ncbi:MAG: bacterial transcriptional activator domain-containing protein [Chloroflexota bacterium]|nr:MAG: bacterial transcriptional activator domain-containing protein [Chloroflexota bacterium]
MADPAASSTPAPELRVQTLGRFVVWRGGGRMSEAEWGREKARRLFQYFITYRRQHIPKERIAGELWPQLDAERADRDFKVALNAVQSVLEPDRPPRTPSSYITRNGLSYGLNIDVPIIVDAVEFEEGITAGNTAEKRSPEQAIDLYRRALDLYQGDYLPDALYEDWSSGKRERLVALYLIGAGRLARLLLDVGDLLETINWSQKVLVVDPCWEEAYRLLMRAHMANGNRPLAVRAYRQCRQALAYELGIEPMNETTKLFEQISQGSSD